MKNKLNLLTILLLGLASCTFNAKKVYIVEAIDVFPTTAQNEELALELLSYNYPYIISVEKGLLIREQMQGMGYSYSINQESGVVSFKLTLNNQSKEYAGTLVPFFENFVREKERLHFEKQEQLEKVKNWSRGILPLVASENIDSLWSIGSSNLKRYVTYDQMRDAMSAQKQYTNGLGETVAEYTWIFDKIGTRKGEFFLVNFYYADGSSEQVTVEKESNLMKFGGYRIQRP